jgi:hypothetical protein
MLLPSDRFAEGASLAKVLALLPDPEDDQKDLSAEDLSGLQLQNTLLVDAILAANRDFPTLADKRLLAADNQKKYFLQNGLLFWQNRLMVPNEGTLRTRLCDEYYRPSYRAHFERKKIREIISQQYAWPGLSVFINRYYGNCPECRRNRNVRLKSAELLQPLPIPERV